MQEMYGIEVDGSRVSKITDKVLPLADTEMAGTPVAERIRDADAGCDPPFSTRRDNGIVVKKEAYIAIGTDMEGQKNVLGIWIDVTESSKYWLNVLNGLKNRRVKDILIASVDGLSGFMEAINTAYLQTEIQRYVIHQIRSSTRHVSYKDKKAFTADLKPIYKAAMATEDLALLALEDLSEALERQISAVSEVMESQLAGAFDDVQIPAGNPKADLHNERDREFQPTATEGDEDEKRVHFG